MDWYGATLYIIGVLFGMLGMLRNKSTDLDGLNFWFSYALILLGSARVCYRIYAIATQHWESRTLLHDAVIFAPGFVLFTILTLVVMSRIIRFLLQRY